MTIRKKTVLVLVLLVALLVGGLWAVLSQVLAAGFSAVEMRDARLNMERVREGFANQQKEVCARTVDWAHWDDTWNYAADKNADFVEANLANLAFDGMNLDMLVIAGTDGKVISAVQKVEGESSATKPADARVIETNFGPSSPFVAAGNKNPDAVVSGFVLTEGRPPLMVCSMPITKSDGAGEVRGWFAFARFFDEDQHQALEKAIKLKMSFVGEGGGNYDVAAKALAVLEDPDSIDVRPASEKILVGHTRFLDVHGKGNIIGRVEIPREIHAQAIASMQAVLIALGGMGLAFALVIILLIERLVLKRLASLSAKVAAITDSFNFEGRVDAAGQDEISKLGGSINGLLAACEQVMFALSGADAAAAEAPKADGEGR